MRWVAEHPQRAQAHLHGPHGAAACPRTAEARMTVRHSANDSLASPIRDRQRRSDLRMTVRMCVPASARPAHRTSTPYHTRASAHRFRRRDQHAERHARTRVEGTTNSPPSSSIRIRISGTVVAICVARDAPSSRYGPSVRRYRRSALGPPLRGAASVTDQPNRRSAVGQRSVSAISRVVRIAPDHQCGDGTPGSRSATGAPRRRRSPCRRRTPSRSTAGPSARRSPPPRGRQSVGSDQLVADGDLGDVVHPVGVGSGVSRAAPSRCRAGPPR